MTASKAKFSDGLEVEFFTAEIVRLRMAEAADTLRRLRMRGVKPGGHGTHWPDILQDFYDAYGYTNQEPLPGVPTPAKIDRMDEALSWLHWIEDRNKRIVFFGKAGGVKTGTIARRLGFHRETVRRWNRDATELILDRLNR